MKPEAFTGTTVGLDPGPRESAFCRMVDGVPEAFDKLPNEELLKMIRHDRLCHDAEVVIELIFPRGKSVGLDTMSTQLWAGRYMEASDWQGWPCHGIDRQDVRFAICGSLDTNDANVRTALIDFYGGSKEAAIGKKSKPGPLFGIKEDMWSALAICVAFHLRKFHRKAS